MADLGGFGWTKVQLFQDSTTVSTDVRFLPQELSRDATEDSSGGPLGTDTRHRTGLQRGRVFLPTSRGAKREVLLTRHRGVSFGARALRPGDVPAAGIRSGDFTVEAAHPPFSP